MRLETVRHRSLRGRCAARGLRVAVAALVAGVLLSAFALPSQARIRFFGVAGSDNAGVAAAEEGIWFSSSTHRDWQPAIGAGEGRTYTGVLGASNGFFLVCADDGTVWRSTTTLASAFVQRATLASGLRGLAEVSSQVLVVGDGGFIARSSDLTGGSWVTLASSTSRDLFAVATNGLTTTVAVGEAGTILRGGRNGSDWQPVSIDETRTLRAVTVDSNGRYLAVGDGGAAWRSDANGTSWVAVDLGTEADLRGASRVGQVVVVVGAGRTILYSPSNLSAWSVRSAPSVDGAGNYELLAVDGTTTPDWIAVGSGRVTLFSTLGLEWLTSTVTPVVHESWGRIKSRFAQ